MNRTSSLAAPRESLPIDLAERGLVPDPLLRLAIRRLCASRRRDEYAGDWYSRFQDRIAQLRRSPVAIETAAANRQHYEVPARLFELCLGPHLKYSACLFAEGDDDLGRAEERMLACYAERAGLDDGQDILELGCGWGSLTLWMAQRFPGSRITAVSNSASQRRHIEARAAERGLANLRVITEDVNRLELPEAGFDRCVSIEMFEHMRNYEALLGSIARWLRPGGALFVHIFCHRELMYPFETEAGDDWMGRHFFTGGLMPAADTLLWFQRDLRMQAQWRIDGSHYQRTANAWLANQDRNADEVMAVMRDTYGADEAARWFQRWRMFWMACAELFGYAGGSEWLVGHYLMRKPG